MEEKRISMGRRREDILGDGKAINKVCQFWKKKQKQSLPVLKVGSTGDPAGEHWQLSLESMTRSWRALKFTWRTWTASEGPGRLLFTEQILMEPGTMMCMEDTVVSPRDRPSPHGYCNLVMETDSEQTPNVKVKHKSDHMIITQHFPGGW